MAGGLTEVDYGRLRRATETYREDLVIRLVGEIGIRPAEIARLHLSDVEAHGNHYFLLVREGNGHREAYVPADVEHDLRKYARVKGIDENERPFDVTARRLQMLVPEVGERAGVDVSSRDLRRYFARSRVREGVPAHVVREVGGWNSLDNLDVLSDDPTRETIAAAFAGVQPSDHLRRTMTVATEVGEALVDADTRQAVEWTVCDRLVRTDGYQFAVLAADEGVLVRRECVGISDDRADAVLDGRARESVDSREILTRTEETPAHVTALTYVPLVHSDRTRGVIAIGMEAEPGPLERDLFGVLGVQVVQALTSVEHRRLLVADTITELEFRSRDDRDAFAALSAALDCRIRLSGMVPADDALVCFVTVEGVDVGEALTVAEEHSAVEDVRLVENHSNGGLVEIAVSTGVPHKVVEHGGRVHGMTAEDGVSTLVAAVAADVDIRRIVDTVTDAFQATRLTAKRDVERPVDTKASFREWLDERLTDRQETALRAAYFGGYYEWPRNSTAEELADTLDVSSPTLHNHLRKAQQKLLTAYFDGAET
ncbi:bacterio-opsin activator domain-containing protein [Haladaptatus sp. DYF46]|uniref:bacterio-opsin activator domain-containing protein n=1 Tax=Haladaptatus sp. DYF46 TaxID=2886041 RepID=UPI001E5B3987|nr:bacterio-opsin activator domain-containing protein [Haladaptatus sp. DYF46]